MKVIQNNYQNKTIVPSNVKQLKRIEKVTVECDNCGSVLEVSREDIYTGWLGLQFVTCPCCNYEMSIEEFDDDAINICASNVKYPTHFMICSKDFTTVEVSDREINKWIQDGIEYFRNHKDEYYWYTGSGNTWIHIYRYDGDEEYCVIVSKDYEEGNIQFEKEDYV